MDVYVRSLDSGASTVSGLKVGDSVSSALEKSGLSASDYNIRVNDQPANIDTALQQDDVVTLARSLAAGI